MALYLSNSAAQSASFRGGIAPVSGRHSVIDKPESVRRVMPPTAIITKTSAKRIISQMRIAPRAVPRPLSMMPVCATGFAASGLATSSNSLRFSAM